MYGRHADHTIKFDLSRWYSQAIKVLKNALYKKNMLTAFYSGSVTCDISKQKEITMFIIILNQDDLHFTPVSTSFI